MKDADKLSREVLERHHDDAFRWAMSCCNYDEERAREIVQSVYLEILEGRAVFNGRSEFRTWLFAVLRNLANRHSRQIQSGEKLLKKIQENVLHGETHGDASEHLAEQEQANDIWSGIASLSMVQRQIVELVYYRDFTLEEAAEILGLRTGTARTHFHRAKRSLARHLNRYEDLEE
jgi:RNA polymerase sigma-70 factor (ECF subfamily)